MYVGNYVQENALNSSPLRNIEKNIHSNFFSITKRPWRELYIDVYKKKDISRIYTFFHIHLYTCRSGKAFWCGIIKYTLHQRCLYDL
jgi:hypothetical protein